LPGSGQSMKGKTVFTNGCFDILHPGHVDLLRRAKELGTHLIVGINSDESVRSIKGADRPFMGQDDRKKLLESLKMVDEVLIFDELTPERLIADLKPDVLVKGGDWKDDEIVGADTVRRNGGQVRSLPLLAGYSSSATAENIRGKIGHRRPEAGGKVASSLREHLEVGASLLKDHAFNIEKAAELIIQTFETECKLLIFGNGGSAADAQHLAAEFVGRYETERRSLPAIALTTDTSAITAISNDYGYDAVFERQLSGLAKKGDCVIGISTSGNSPNVISAVMKARSIGCKIISLTGINGKKLASLSDVSIMVSSSRTARIQEAHIVISHIWCQLVDQAFLSIDSNKQNGQTE
jgi:D-sedoheptulose 7-phosphate isomerase